MSKAGRKIATSHYRVFIFSVVSLYFLSSFDGTRLIISLPVIADHFYTGTGLASWIVVAYFLAFISSMLILGRLSDILNIRLFLKLGVFVFALFSAFCGLAENLLMLIVFRFIQGLGGAMIVVSSYSAIARYPSEDLGVRGYAAMNIASAIALGIGAPVGGVITEYLGWRWNFHINLILALCLYFMAMRGMPVDEEPSRAKLDFDIGGAVSGFLAPLSFMLFISFAKELGFTSMLLWSFFLAGLASTIFFVMWENRVAHPLFDFRLFKIEGLGLMLILIITPIVLQGGHTFLMPFYFDDIKAMRIVHYGSLLMIYSLVFIIAGFIGPLMMKRFHFRAVSTAGFLSMMTGCALMIFGLQADGLAVPVTYLVLMGFGFGIYNAPSTSAVMAMIPPDHKGLFSGVFQIILRTSLAMGIIIFETIYSAGTGSFSETLFDESLVSPEHLNALHLSYRMAFAAGFALIAVALIILHVSARKLDLRSSSEPCA